MREDALNHCRFFDRRNDHQFAATRLAVLTTDCGDRRTCSDREDTHASGAKSAAAADHTCKAAGGIIWVGLRKNRTVFTGAEGVVRAVFVWLQEHPVNQLFSDA